MNVSPSTVFESVAQFATGLAGTIGVRIDQAGTTITGRVTAGIAEYPAGSGIYHVSLTSPAAAGQYQIVWDDTTLYVVDDLLVVFSAPGSIAPSGRDLCSITDVTRLVPGYNAGDDTATDDRLSELVTEQSRDAMERTGREFTPIAGLNPRSFDLDRSACRHRRVFIGDLANLSSVTVLDAVGDTIQSADLGSVIAEPRIREDWEPIATLWFRVDAPIPVPMLPGYVVEVDGTWGFPSVPTTVKDAVARLVIVRFLNDVAYQGTQFADAANRAEFSIASSIASAFQALERFYVPILQSSGDFSPSWNAGVAGVDW